MILLKSRNLWNILLTSLAVISALLALTGCQIISSPEFSPVHTPVHNSVASENPPPTLKVPESKALSPADSRQQNLPDQYTNIPVFYTTATDINLQNKILSGTLLPRVSICRSPFPVVNYSLPDICDNMDKPITDLWQRIRAGYQLNLNYDNRKIRSQMKWYQSHQAYLNRVTERARNYMYLIVEELENRQLPTELALLPIVESAYDPFAYSHGRASGMWQIIPATGRHYGLKQNWWYDGRRDIKESTRAALDYLEILHNKFNGDWLLALAAYNTGEGRVQRAITRNRKASRKTDFWSLRLPRETRAYVPKLLAIAKIIQTPENHNISLRPIANSPYLAEVNIESQIDLSQAAKLADISIDDIYNLNPAFKRWATDPNGPHRLLIPASKLQKFKENIKFAPPQQRMRWRRYKIRQGDSLNLIAKRYHTTPRLLKKVNRIRGNMIQQGKTLLIPMAMQNASYYAKSDYNRKNKQKLKTAQLSGQTKIAYTVRPGDSLWGISRRHGVNVKKLASWNSMAVKDILHTGQQLVIWKNKPIDTSSLQLASFNPTPHRVIRKLGYRVKNGDSLYQIANKFNVTVKDITKWNTLNPSHYLQPGQLITLFVDMSNIN